MTVAGACRPTPFEVQEAEGAVTVTTRPLTARVALPKGEVTFLDREGRALLAEKKGGGKSLVPAAGHGRVHLPRAGRVRAGGGRGVLRARGAPERPHELRGPRRRHVPAQHRGHRAVPRLEPGLRRALGQHLPHALRRPEGARARAGQAALRRRRAARAASTGTYRQGDCQTGTVVATRVDPQIAFGAPEDRPADLGDPQRRASHDAGRSIRAWSPATPASSGRARSRARRPATTTS